MSKPARNGLDALLRPEDSVLVLIDHQPYQLANLNSHDPHMAVNNATGLAKAAKVFNVPTILTSVVQERGGVIFPQITGVFPGQDGEVLTFFQALFQLFGFRLGLDQDMAGKGLGHGISSWTVERFIVPVPAAAIQLATADPRRGGPHPRLDVLVPWTFPRC